MSAINDAWKFIKATIEWKEITEAARQVPSLEDRIAKIEARLSGSLSDAFCEHCGSGNIKRTGSRLDPTFKDFGVRQTIYSCLDCQKETAITPDQTRK